MRMLQKAARLTDWHNDAGVLMQPSSWMKMAGHKCQEAAFFLPRYLLEKQWGRRYKEMVSSQMAGLCEDHAKILDFGCDDGAISHMLMEINPSLTIVGVDIQALSSAWIPKAIYDGQRLPFADNAFDAVLVIDVLHHATDILALLREIDRVCKKRIIIKDHTVYGFLSRNINTAFDYITNEPFGIKCAYNYCTPEQWQEYFDQVNWELIEQPNLHYGMGIGARYNPIFKLQKRATQPLAQALQALEASA